MQEAKVSTLVPALRLPPQLQQRWAAPLLPQLDVWVGEVCRLALLFGLLEVFEEPLAADALAPTPALPLLTVRAAAHLLPRAAGRGGELSVLRAHCRVVITPIEWRQFFT